MDDIRKGKRKEVVGICEWKKQEWEECRFWGEDKTWQKMVGMVLGEEREGEEWLEKIERSREGEEEREERMEDG